MWYRTTVVELVVSKKPFEGPGYLSILQELLVQSQAYATFFALLFFYFFSTLPTVPCPWPPNEVLSSLLIHHGFLF